MSRLRQKPFHSDSAQHSASRGVLALCETFHGVIEELPFGLQNPFQCLAPRRRPIPVLGAHDVSHPRRPQHRGHRPRPHTAAPCAASPTLPLSGPVLTAPTGAHSPAAPRLPCPCPSASTAFRTCAHLRRLEIASPRPRFVCSRTNVEPDNDRTDTPASMAIDALFFLSFVMVAELGHPHLDTVRVTGKGRRQRILPLWKEIRMETSPLAHQGLQDERCGALRLAQEHAGEDRRRPPAIAHPRTAALEFRPGTKLKSRWAVRTAYGCSPPARG